MFLINILKSVQVQWKQVPITKNVSEKDLRDHSFLDYQIIASVFPRAGYKTNLPHPLL